MTKRIIFPRPVPSEFKISSPFGERVLEGKTSFHKGIDFACPVGSEVRAVIDGVVVRAGIENELAPKQGYGIRVMQSLFFDGLKYICWYGHLSKSIVNDGDKITAGQLIGLSGNTGHSTGPHLHFGIRRQDSSEFYDVQWEVKK